MSTNRKYWIETMLKFADPVLTAMAAGQLKQVMPVEAKLDRTDCTYLEAIGRLLAGLAPWLELEIGEAEESELHGKYSELARQAIDAASDPNSPDYAFALPGEQPNGQLLVDTAFLAHAIVRAPNELWSKLEKRVQQNVMTMFKRSRVIRPFFNNWLLFSAMVEVALFKMGEQPDHMRLDYAIKQHEQWYKGDGTYGDGPAYAWDYYNSYVIQPMLLDTVHTMKHTYGTHGDELHQRVLKRARRYAEVQERLIAPDGSFPAVGRSLAYRCGAFQTLAQIALFKELPASISPAQVRCALQAMIQRTMDAPGTYDENGWLQIGLCGHQPSIGENYISTGSLYLCSTAFLPLGLPPEDDFWLSANEMYTAQKAWSGQDLAANHALHG